MQPTNLLSGQVIVVIQAFKDVVMRRFNFKQMWHKGTSVHTRWYVYVWLSVQYRVGCELLFPVRLLCEAYNTPAWCGFVFCLAFAVRVGGLVYRYLLFG